MKLIKEKTPICELVIAHTDEYQAQSYWQVSPQAERDAELIAKSLTEYIGKQVRKTKFSSLAIEELYEHNLAKKEVRKVILINNKATNDIYIESLVEKIKSNLSDLIDTYKRILKEQGSEINSVIILAKGKELPEESNKVTYMVENRSAKTFLYDFISALHGRAKSSKTSFSINVLGPYKPANQTLHENSLKEESDEQQKLKAESESSSEDYNDISKPEETFVVTPKPAHKTVSSSTGEPLDKIFTVNWVNDIERTFSASFDNKTNILIFEQSDRDLLLEAQQKYQTVKALIVLYTSLSRGKVEVTGGKATNCELVTIQESLGL